MFGPGLVCDRFQFIQPLPDFVGHRALGPSHIAVDQKDGGEQLWMSVVDAALLPDAAAKSEYLSRIRPLAALRHPSLVRIRVIEADDERVFIGYEALPGALVLEDIMTRFGMMSSTLVLERARSVARGLDALHRRGMVHGGVDGTTVVTWEEQCLLLNYGLFSGLHPDRFRELARRTGHVTVWPPEVLRGEFTPACDVFAWGVLVAQMLTGEAPAAAVVELDDRARKYDVSLEFLELIRACTHTDPAERPRDATHLVARLENFESITGGRVEDVSDGVALPPPPSPSEIGSDYGLNFGESPAAMPHSDDGDSDTDGVVSMTQLSVGAGKSEFDSSPDLEVPEISRAPSRPEKRPSQPTAKLSSLAAEIVGEDGVEALGSVFDGVASAETDASISSVDLENLALGVEAAVASDVGLSLIGGGDPTEFDTFATRKSDAPEATQDDQEIKLERKKKIKLRLPRRERRPGPHGPPPNFVSRGVMLAAGALTFLFTLHVASQRGGYEKLLDPEFSAEIAISVESAVTEIKSLATAVMGPEKSAPKAAVARTGGGAEAGTNGDETAGDSGGGTGGETTTGVVEPPAVYKACERGTVAINEEVCVDIAEYPGLRKIPRADVSFRDAEAACGERGARLCSMEEWKAACDGGEGRRYPYGNLADAHACNTASPAGYPQDVRRTGSASGCVTPSGVYDLIGNVGEWVSDGRAIGGDSTSPHKAVHCGKWGSPPRGFSSDLLGFRCCEDRLVE